MNSPNRVIESHGEMSANLDTQSRPLTEREKSLELTETYRRFIVFLFFKIKGCLDTNLMDSLNLKTLAFSSLEKDEIIFRCGAALKITIPKSLYVTGITLSQLDHLSDDWIIAVNGTEIDKDVWTSHQVNLYGVRDAQGVAEGVREEVKSIIAIEKSKDRSLRGKRVRLFDKLMGISTLEREVKEAISTKLHQPEKPKFTTLEIKRRI